MKISLDSVLHVPQLSYNLLSISKLTKSQNCSITFFSNRCVFQDLTTRKMIGSSEKREGLLYLTILEPEDLAYQVRSNVNKEKEEWLQHKRLGYLNFSALRVLYSDLLRGFDISDFKCEICELAKSHHVSYLLRNKRCDSPFTLIHTDVWGPSKIFGLLGAR